jgi:carbon-monoxide dehydrogenase medium subunit
MRSRSSNASEDGKAISGGMTLLPTMKMRLAQPATLVDLSGIDGLKASRSTARPSPSVP